MEGRFVAIATNWIPKAVNLGEHLQLVAMCHKLTFRVRKPIYLPANAQFISGRYRLADSGLAKRLKRRQGGGVPETLFPEADALPS